MLSGTSLNYYEWKFPEIFSAAALKRPPASRGPFGGELGMGEGGAAESLFLLQGNSGCFCFVLFLTEQDGK